MGRLIFGDDILPLLCHTHGRKGVKSEFGTRASACVRVPEMSGQGLHRLRRHLSSAAKEVQFYKNKKKRHHLAMQLCPLYGNIRSKSEYI